MKTKIIIATLILFITIGIVAATDINNLNMPDGWESLNDGTYHEIGDSAGGGSGQNMIIQKWADSLKDEYYQNITDEEYTVMDTGNNTFMYIDDLNENAGSFEVVEIDGEKYFVNFWTVDYTDTEEITDTSFFLVKFNELNDLEPIAV